ncbi:hypothetical protein [Taklimakanibacter deserti]|jgi:hypothetical protein|uniref:hypothetical protein n=1 Tax=Taklimakanibacter deserti TaxID=2267839 RepID=UPI000E6505B7
MSKSKLIWSEEDHSAKANFTIDHVGRLNFEVASDLPGAGLDQPAAERRALALRHAKLLVRNLANELERQSP